MLHKTGGSERNLSTHAPQNLAFLIRINGFAALQNRGATTRHVSVFAQMGAIFCVIAKKLPLKRVKALGFPFPAKPFSIYTFTSDVLRCCCD
ncbi:hypothetical protein [Roseovarius rhodophyticola]|uniref:Uncharacterized protein n=1 Tax=Roseovarius rhodophyticola TaxID=3080827 RepID=A0ABZ2TGG3_9RHOB|nr:hypothetical protein [Roseovarius sp. W115]MDV2928980.1 hypothetical protein [Roseovarius sp. W115]